MISSMKIEDLIAENKTLKEMILRLEEQIKALQKMIFGTKSERFIDNPSVQYLPGLEPGPETASSEITVTVPLMKSVRQNLLLLILSPIPMIFLLRVLF